MTTRAVPFPEHSTWLNTPTPLSLADLKGHVVLLDFWTYCCINCIHVLPDLTYLEEKYQNEPFVVIGIHAAKFDNEQNPAHVRSAIERYEIQHPVISDSDHTLWRAYGVHAWPTLILLDTEGTIRGQASGEGNRDIIDNAIGKLLNEGKKHKTLTTQPLLLRHQQKKNTQTLSFPGKIAANQEKNQLIISDSNNNRVVICEREDPTHLTICSIVGSGIGGAEDGPGEKASFKHPQGICLHKGDIYICDTENHLIRRVRNKGKKNQVKTIAGVGEQGNLREYAIYEATLTALNSPWDILSHGENLYIAMAGSHQIWKLTPHTGELQPYAGTGGENIRDGWRKSADLAQPSGLHREGKVLYIADSEVSAIRCLDLQTEQVSTLVGNGLFEFGFEDGTCEEALLQHPLGVYAEGETLYIADTYNHAIRIIDTKSCTISTLVGKNKEKNTCTIENKDCTILPLYEPNDVLLWGDTLYITDTNNHLIRAYNRSTKTLSDVQIRE